MGKSYKIANKGRWFSRELQILRAFVNTTPLGLKPVVVSRRVLAILQQSGAYGPIHERARQSLLDSDQIPDFGGLDRLRAALRTLVHSLPSDKVSVRQYKHCYPTVVWDEKNNLIALAQPKPCQEHPAEECFCWIGPALHDITKGYDYSAISTTKLWSVFAMLMGGNTTVKRVAPTIPMDTSGGSRPNSNASTQSTAAPRQVPVNNRTVITPKQPHRSVSNVAMNNAPGAAHNQGTTPSAATQSAVVPAPGDASFAPAQPLQTTAEAAADKALAAKISKRLLGFDPVQKYDELANKLHLHEKIVADQTSTLAAHERRIQELITSVAAKDTEIVALKKENKRMQDDLAEEGAAAHEVLERARKRKKDGVRFLQFHMTSEVSIYVGQGP
ncbi:hypothetical protein MSAN_01100900 [Mycena sanguinolenta]|uniref:Uncharacterized protein n=1 Tax=Mycena sanguinolenta TaxID=230812 RepID=A0A8H6YT54_9AGAR|nr:hypothetical protein MSAN_01100900 [Mycena sanguinolenta]